MTEPIPRRRRQGPAARRGFSLIEVLLAIFILGIGIISIGAIFPAGIVQQRQSFDDSMGPVVAENALALLRTKVSQSDFGFAEDFAGFALSPLTLDAYEGTYGLIDDSAPRTFGDWGWRRPALVRQPWVTPQVNFPTLGGAVPPVPPGSTLIFNSLLRPSNLPVASAAATLSEVPWNRRAYGDEFPLIVLTPQDRSYPSFAAGSPQAQANPPQYFWECMFRRYQGRVQVAIFVYRVAGTEQRGAYVPAETLGGGVAARFGVPHRQDFESLPAQWANLPHPTLLNAPGTTNVALVPPEVVPGTNPNTPLDLASTAAQWQLPGQWLLDPNGNIHRVLAGRRVQQDGPVRLAAPLPRLAPPARAPNFATGDPGTSLRTFWRMGDPNNRNAVGSVGTIWYLPAEDARGYRLTPIFVTVKEL
jgi:prepilin-type N-terminal cleavage/methylation domain-containing protein